MTAEEFAKQYNGTIDPKRKGMEVYAINPGITIFVPPDKEQSVAFADMPFGVYTGYRFDYQGINYYIVKTNVGYAAANADEVMLSEPPTTSVDTNTGPDKTYNPGTPEVSVNPPVTPPDVKTTTTTTPFYKTKTVKIVGGVVGLFIVGKIIRALKVSKND